MNKQFFKSNLVIIFCMFFINGVLFAGEKFDKKTGILKLNAKTQSGSVVKVEACRIKCPNDEFFKNVFLRVRDLKEKDMPKYFLYSLDVYFNGIKASIPPVSVLSVFEPDEISFESNNKDEYTVTIKENTYNASESFKLLLYMSGNRTIKYSVITPYCPDKPLSETVYNDCEF